MRSGSLGCWSLAASLALGACSPAAPAQEPIGESTARPRVAKAATAALAGGESDAAPLEQRAARLHERAIVIDGHDDVPTLMLAGGTGIELDSPWAHTSLAKMKRGGITGSFFSIYVEGDLAEKPTVTGGGPLRRAIDLIDLTYRQVERHPDALMLAMSADDVRRAKREGKVAVLMGVEGGHAIESSLSALRVLYRLGCRYMTLTHTNTNEWADSAGFSGPPPVRHHGLAPFGEEVVREMQRIGMLVDVSHVSDETFAAVMRVAEAPVIASHSSARAVADHRRNLSDDMLRAIAKNGGVAMVNFWSLFLSNEFGAASRAWFDKHGAAHAELRARHKQSPLAFREALAKLRAETEPLPKVPLSKLIDHIEHMIAVAGVDHVGLGSDFDGVDALPEGITGVDALPKITLELLRRGHSEEDVLKILGENFLRVLARAEAFAQSKGTRLSGDGSLRRIDR
ncbi:MAG: dipeptidase [Labilithrix sp.]|nr:dipeptidase [Labilithrix sp.]